MLSATEIRNVRFSSSVGGYKRDEVDVLLDKIEADYAQYERAIRDYQARLEEMNKELSDLKEAQASIQNVLLSAQRLADRIVSEAKEKSDEIIKNAEANISVITAHEKELSTTFELKAQERKAALEKELQQMVEEARIKADSITAAANDSVARQQMLFDKLKMEIASFKSGITAKYKEHLEILSTIPDSVPSDPTHIAKIVTACIDREPDASSFIVKATEPEVIDLALESEEETAEESND